jgi:CDP-diacylglycerol--glycerol-3-phosphate 3-phosphatidyltransferase
MGPQLWPNLLSLSRLVGLPFLLWLLFSERLFDSQILRVAVLVVSYTVLSLTDYWDGYLSRKYQVTSRFGEFLDPLADKVLVVGIYLAFLFLPWIVLPPGLIIAIVAREVLITAFRIRALSQHKVMKTERHGKIKTTVQFVSQGLVWAVMLTYAIAADVWAIRPAAGSVLQGAKNHLEQVASWATPLITWVPLACLALACFLALSSWRLPRRGYMR